MTDEEKRAISDVGLPLAQLSAILEQLSDLAGSKDAAMGLAIGGAARMAQDAADRASTMAAD